MMKAFPSITIPDAVRHEIIEKGKIDGYSDSLTLEKLETKGWIQTVSLSSSEARKVAEELGEEIGKGEAEAIALALEKKERLFIDDKKGRQAANLYGIETTTTLGIMFELLISTVLPKQEYRKNVKNYGSQGWIAGDIIQEFLERGDEFE
jgi:predicted nucleic acid-binding protein